MTPCRTIRPTPVRPSILPLEGAIVARRQAFCRKRCYSKYVSRRPVRAGGLPAHGASSRSRTEKSQRFPMIEHAARSTPSRSVLRHVGLYRLGRLYQPDDHLNRLARRRSFRAGASVLEYDLTTPTSKTRHENASDQQVAELFREHSSFIYRTASKVVGNAYDAQEVVQTISSCACFAEACLKGFGRDPKGYPTQRRTTQGHYCDRESAGRQWRSSRKSGNSRWSVTTFSKRPPHCTAMTKRAEVCMGDRRTRTRTAVEILDLRYRRGGTAMREQPRGMIASMQSRIRETLAKLMNPDQCAWQKALNLVPKALLSWNGLAAASRKSSQASLINAARMHVFRLANLRRRRSSKASACMR